MIECVCPSSLPVCTDESSWHFTDWVRYISMTEFVIPEFVHLDKKKLLVRTHSHAAHMLSVGKSQTIKCGWYLDSTVRDFWTVRVRGAREIAHVSHARTSFDNCLYLCEYVVACVTITMCDYHLYMCDHHLCAITLLTRVRVGNWKKCHGLYHVKFAEKMQNKLQIMASVTQGREDA